MKRGIGKRQDIEARTIEIAGLLGRTFSLALVRAAAGSSVGIDALLERGILAEGSQAGQGRFVKATEAGKIGARVPWSRRRRHFVALGEAAVRLRCPPKEIASYFERAGQEETARKWWVKAAEKACAAGAYLQAMTCLDRALSVWPWNEFTGRRVDVLREMARCAVNGGKSDPARRAWEELADFAADAGRPSLEVEALRQLAGLGTDAARISEYLRRAAEVAESHLAPAEAVRAILSYVDHLACRVRITAAVKELKRAVRIAERSDDAALVSEVRGWQGLLAAMSGKHGRAHELVEESLRIAVKHELAEQAALAYRRRANLQDYHGRYAEEKRAHTGAIEFCRRTQVAGELVCLGCMSYACFRTGDWQEAMRSARAVMRDPNAVPTVAAIGACVLGLVQAFRGERGPARRNLETALKRFRIEGFAGMEFFALLGVAYLAQADGDTTAAIEVFDQIRALWRETDDLHDVIPALIFAGAVYADAGHADRLADCLDILGRVLRKNPLGEAKAALAVLRAEQARVEGRLLEADAGWADAATEYAALNLPLERLWTESRRVKLGRTQDADAVRGEAVILARRLGMRPMLAALQAGGRESSPDGDLTARQAQVLRFLAGGLTSKEIADRMGLSARTVEMHVSRLLQRLNCRTRPEAIRAAIDRGWLQTR